MVDVIVIAPLLFKTVDGILMAAVVDTVTAAAVVVDVDIDVDVNVDAVAVVITLSSLHLDSFDSILLTANLDPIVNVVTTEVILFEGTELPLLCTTCACLAEASAAAALIFREAATSSIEACFLPVGRREVGDTLLCC